MHLVDPYMAEGHLLARPDCAGLVPHLARLERWN